MYLKITKAEQILVEALHIEFQQNVRSGLWDYGKINTRLYVIWRIVVAENSRSLANFAGNIILPIPTKYVIQLIDVRKYV